MDIKTSYEHVMGVSGACYRLAFCSPGWDYSSVDGLVAYDYATPGYKAFGYTAKFADRVDKENRAKERSIIVDEIRHNMPVLGINVRVAPEWGVICGYKENGADLFCRSKYDAQTINSPEFEKGRLNVELLGQGYTWLDTGTHESLVEATNFVKAIESHQHRKIACLEEIAYLNGWITRNDLMKVYEVFKKNEYGQYLKDILDGKYLDAPHLA
jgi:hypothetical protein